MVEINDPEKVKEVLKIIESVKKEAKEKEIEDFIGEFKEKGDGIFGVMNIGGYENYQEIPEGFKVLAKMRIANTQDHRQNLTHTYAVALIDTKEVEELKQLGKKMIKIQVPDNMKGLVIGKRGSNIKKASEELGVFIKVI